MGQYYHLKIFKAIYAFCLELNTKMIKFPRYHRYTLGEKLSNFSLKACHGIYCANKKNTPESRARKIEEILEDVQYLFILLRLSYDLKALSKEAYLSLFSSLRDCESQLIAWQTYCININNDKKRNQNNQT